MYFIGITGAIAAGKSTVCQILTDAGFAVIDADDIAHELLSTDEDVWAKLASRYGEEILDTEGNIDRSALARIVFSDADEKAYLEAVLHPLIEIALFTKMAQRAKTSPYGLVFVEAALIFESGHGEDFDEIWLVECTLEQQQERLVNDRYLSPEEAMERIESQADITDEDKENSRHIDNSRTFEYTKAQVDELVVLTIQRLKDETNTIDRP